MRKRKNGEGTWGTKKINGFEYKFFRDTDGKYFYGKTEKEVNQKRKEYTKKQKEKIILDDSCIFVDYVTEYINNKKLKIESTTLDGYEYLISGMLKKYPIANYELSALNETLMREYIEDLSKKYARSSIEKLVRVLKPCLKYAVEHNHISTNPLDYVDIPSESNVIKKKKVIPYIVEDDLNKLYKECKRINKKGYNWGGKIGESTYGNNAYAIVLIGHTGLRVSELIGLRWKDVDIKNKKLYIRNAVVQIRDRKNGGYTTKNKEPKSKAGIREIPLSNIALEMIEFFSKQNPKHKDDDYVVINKDGNSPKPRNLTKTLNAMLVRGECSIQKCGLHGLRHGFGAILLTKKVDIKIVSKLLGHEKISTTYDIYIDFTKEQVESNMLEVFNNLGNKK